MSKNKQASAKTPDTPKQNKPQTSAQNQAKTSKDTAPKQAPVLTSELACAAGNIGLLTLNRPEALNSLSLEVVRQLREALDTWEQDDNIAIVILNSSNDKAFCAGGDLREMYDSCVATPGGPCIEAEQFFLEEYQLDHLIHRYTKPIVCFGHGIVMGGGMGLMAGASHRVVSERSRIAMPEVGIGLFPDVGGSYFMNRIPRGLGVFFSLTGAPINALDALWCQLADYALPSTQIPDCIEQLSNTKWQPGQHQHNHQQVSQILQRFNYPSRSLANLIEAQIPSHLSLLEQISQQDCLGEFMHQLTLAKGHSSFIDKAIKALEQGSELSALITFEQLRRFRHASLEIVLQSELALATNIMRRGDIAEGIRALIIDKDQTPKWQFEHFSAIPASTLESFFARPWDDSPMVL